MSTPRQQEPNDVVAWLIEGAPSAIQPQDVLAQLCDRLTVFGLPLHRVAVYVQTLHPDVMGRQFIWRPGQPVDVSDGAHSILSSDLYLQSPFPDLYHHKQAIRRRIEDPNSPDDYNILGDLRSEGVTDYLLQPLPFTNGQIHAVSYTTARPGGFSEADLAALEAVRLPLTRVAEIYALRRTATNLLDTYVGHHAGARVLRGQIRRGEIERIDAVIMMTDLRGFTTFSDRLPGDQVLGLLNGYFDCLVPAIAQHDGEVLKFVGDGLLAIFPVDGEPANACRHALAAANEARLALARLNEERKPGNPLRQGMALHLGDVFYGNIGSGGRLDFTAIGPAVNLAARLENLTRDLSRDLVVSARFAGHCADALESLGTFELRGFREPQEVFAPTFPGPTPQASAA